MNVSLERSIVVLEPMVNRLVLVGRHVTDLLVTDRATVKTRPLFSVDAVVTALSYSTRDRLTRDLPRLGLRPETRPDGLTGRWITEDGAIIELIASDDPPGGTPNPWHEYALECTVSVSLGAYVVRVAGAPAFLALRLAEFSEQKAESIGPCAALEDALTVLNGRPGVDREVAAAPADVRRFIAERASTLSRRPDADSLLELHIPDAARFPQLAVTSLKRLRTLAAL